MSNGMCDQKTHFTESLIKLGADLTRQVNEKNDWFQTTKDFFVHKGSED